MFLDGFLAAALSCSMKAFSRAHSAAMAGHHKRSVPHRGKHLSFRQGISSLGGKTLLPLHCHVVTCLNVYQPGAQICSCRRCPTRLPPRLAASAVPDSSAGSHLSTEQRATGDCAGVRSGREPSVAAAVAQMRAGAAAGSVQTMSGKQSDCSGQRSCRSNNGQALSTAR